MAESQVVAELRVTKSVVVTKQRFGFTLFSFYVLAYVVFVWLSVATFGTVSEGAVMAKRIGSMNVAVFSGFILILVCIVMAFVYDFYCKKVEQKQEGVVNVDL